MDPRQHTRRRPAPNGALTRVAVATLPMVLALACTSGVTRDDGTAARRPSILLVTLDTTRPDHLSIYDYARRTTPGLDRLSRDSVVYTRMWSVSSWTLPSHASLFTGLFPAAHGAHFDVEGSSGIGGLRAGALDDRFMTVAELLGEHGYQTAAVVGGPWLKRVFGLMQGFASVDDDVNSLAGRRGDEISDAALAWLESTSPDAPVFLFLNYFDPHAPYDPPPGFDDYPRAKEKFRAGLRWNTAVAGKGTFSKDERQIMIDRYDGEIRAMDHQISRVLEAFLSRPGGETSLVVITGDHGESFGEGGRWLHNTWLSEEQLRVPLMVRYPDLRRAGERDDSIVQLPDVFRLIVEEAGVEVPAGTQGVQPGDRTQGFAELYRNAAHLKRYGDRFDRDLQAIIEWPDKLVVSDKGTVDLVRIDGAQEEPATDASGRTEELDSALQSHHRAIGRSDGATPEIDSQTLEELRALGYAD